MEQATSVRHPIRRSLLLGSSVFVAVLVAVLSLIAYLTFSSTLYARYDAKLKDVITFVEHNVDADDLATCIRTSERSQKYDELQQLLNSMVDDFELEYLYIVIPSPETMTNVIAATSAAERAAGEDDMGLLETRDAYSSTELQRYLSYWEATDVAMFEEASDFGRFYTGCKPLRDSNGETVALVCADLSVEALHRSLLTFFGGSLVTILVLLGIFSVFATSWISANITEPLLALEQSARTFASKSHDAEDVSQLVFEPPVIETGNEIESLASTIAKMARDVRTHVSETLDAQLRASEAERENALLSEEARTAEKIAELSESVTSLFTNIPGPTFSKDAKTGVYLACNQAFAEYAHKDSPSGVVGLTDYEIFDAVTAQHFVDDDKRALSMDEPYMFFEDVFDAVGEPKQFQTTKMKFYDTSGRLCTLGMCVDVTELVSARRAYEQARDESATYFRLARALSSDYRSLYYVDLETDAFVSYRHSSNDERLAAERRGEDFFGSFLREACERIYEPDREEFAASFTKQNILGAIEQMGTYTTTYRLLLQGKPTYLGLKATFADDDGRYLVIGISNIDKQTKQLEAAKRVKEERATIARITALSGDYLAIYTVDPDNDHYTVYSSSSGYRNFVSLREGDNFFRDARKRAETIVAKEDYGMFCALMVKERVVSEIRAHGLFAMTFRALVNDEPLYVSLRAAMVEERDQPQLIVGINNIDAQIKRDQEFTAVQDRASKDALTGVKNKHAYADTEAEINARIEAGEEVAFAIVVCDLNNLKETNDTQGHQAGDRLLMDACATICDVFKHSPVFRIGGDEFTVILQGHDFENLGDLLGELNAANKVNEAAGRAVVAWGVSSYQPGDSVSSVFDRADAAMYKVKRSLKVGR